MCMYSLYSSRGTRRAKVGENLVAGEFRGHGALIAATDNQLACIKHETVLCIVEMQLGLGVAEHLRQAYNGKTLDVTLFDGSRRVSGRRYASDMIVMPDGVRIPLAYLAAGTVAFIPKKVRSDKGTKKPRNLTKAFKLDARSLGQVKADEIATTDLVVVGE